MQRKLSPRVRRSSHTRRSYPHALTNHSNPNHNSNNNSSSNNNNNDSNNKLQVSHRSPSVGWWWWWGGSFSFPCNRRKEFAYVAFVTAQVPIINGYINNVGENNDHNHKGGISNDNIVGRSDGTTTTNGLKERVENDESSEGVYLDDGLTYDQQGMFNPRIQSVHTIIHFLRYKKTLLRPI